jgi:peptidoglycan/LPS O-acetylase OafA/YrhL
MPDEKAKVYFPALNALRFFAALLVFTCHVELMKGRNGINNYYNIKTFQTLGGSSVTFFFVLSGFLITYLLFAEKSSSGTISVSKFYLRRILRIWPLYYTVVMAGLFLIPHISFLHISISEHLRTDFNYKLFLFIFFMPNVSYVLFPHTPYISPCWSIGVEEQFYLVWPLLFKNTKNHLRLFVILIPIIYGIKLILTFAIKYSSHIKARDAFENILQIMYFTRFECMILGGICAYILYHERTAVLAVIYNFYTQVICYALIIFFLITGFSVPVIQHIIYSILFGIMILNVATNPRSLLHLENQLLNYLGQISFGLYMYHELAIGITVKILKAFPFNFNGGLFSIVLYLAALLVTIGIAASSYRFLEKPFLKLKTRFSKLTDKRMSLKYKIEIVP